ncbi:MAG: hypothetical protein K2X81_07630, partial [Candidatus Obscuribacterales bacterium]|nr:hypothetical protein [Candidatus Obscuribacterales bacterium]
MKPTFKPVYSDKKTLLDVVKEHKLGPDRCFLCGIQLVECDNATKEHVIPRWLQTRFNLWNQTLQLLNGTSIPYKSLTIPACHQCNNRLSRIETSVERSTAVGKVELDKVDPVELFLWLAKIFFGILHKETFLALDRKNSSSGPIVSDEMIRAFEMIHYFLQAANVQMEFAGFFPASIFVFDLQVPPDKLYWF